MWPFSGRFLWNTLLSFYDHPPKVHTLRKMVRLDEYDAEWAQYFSVADAKQLRRDHAAARKSSVLFCQHCDKPEEKKGSFMLCKRCKDNFGRKWFTVPSELLLLWLLCCGLY
jgi:hypothetical protein